MTRLARLAAAELIALRGRRLWWAVVVGGAGSFAGGFAIAALVLPFDEASAVESSIVVVSRGSTAAVAVALLASLAVAGPYRDGAWMHAALAAPSPGMRMIAGAVPVVALSTGVAAIAVTAAAAGAAVLDPDPLAALPLAAAGHLAVVAVWSVWMLCLAHATRSPLATLAVGAGLPLAVEPAIAGALALSAIPGARWLLPGATLRSLAELPIGIGAVVEGPSLADAPMLAAAALGWTALAILAAWARAHGAPPR
ncbi:hypothetical protein [Agrococcus sp. DT81.2]|uniref:hypothetical protein n=1 Tax=Agrococcus sp. DT81.2 TaxID=3393414 RepID=UPI003CE4964B